MYWLESYVQFFLEKLNFKQIRLTYALWFQFPTQVLLGDLTHLTICVCLFLPLTLQLSEGSIFIRSLLAQNILLVLTVLNLNSLTRIQGSI